MDRRRFLKLGGVGTAILVAGCSTTDPDKPTPTPPNTPVSNTTPMQRFSDRFDTAIDLTGEGVSADATESITPYLERYAADDTLLYLPPGRYLMDEALKLDSFSNLGIVGERATIVPPEGYEDGLFIVTDEGGANGFLFEGLTFDFRAEDTGARPLLVRVADGLEVRDITVRGTQDVEVGMFRVEVTDEDGQGIVERLRLPDGGTEESATYGCYVGDANRGDITFDNCTIVGFPDNGLYAEPPAGTMTVVGGYYANNDVSNVRISKGVIKGVHVRCDTAIDGWENMRGIRLRQGSGTVIEDCLVEFSDVTSSDGAIVLASPMGAATIRNTRIHIDTDGIAAIIAKPPESDDDTDRSLSCENVCILGSASGTAAIRVEDRPNSVFEKVNIYQTGPDRDGIYLADADDSLVSDTSVSVTGRPFRFVNSEVRKRNVTVGENSEQLQRRCRSRRLRLGR